MEIEAILMSTHNIYFYGEITKIIPKLFSNTLIYFIGKTFAQSLEI